MQLLYMSVKLSGTSEDYAFSKTMHQEDATIGRLNGNYWVLPDAKKHIPSQHALINYRSSDCYIVDTSSHCELSGFDEMAGGQ